MSKKVIYSEFADPFWLDVAERLSAAHSWQPVYWLCISDNEHLVRQRFPDVVYQTTVDAVRGIIPSEYKNLELKTIDQPLLDSLMRL